MFSEFQVDTSELKKLRDIRIGMTDDDQPFLVFTYEKTKLSERVLALVCWSVVDKSSRGHRRCQAKHLQLTQRLTQLCDPVKPPRQPFRIPG
jgi:hypothetical protein